MSVIHTGQAVGWYRCDGKDCPICDNQSETSGPAELALADMSLRCPKCASPSLTSRNDRSHRCLHCLTECTDETALPSVARLRKQSYQEGYTAGLEKRFDGLKCNRCQTTAKTVRVQTGFAGEEELLCGGCVSDIFEKLESLAQSERGKLGGAVKSSAKAKAARKNGKKGGRPRKGEQADGQ